MLIFLDETFRVWKEKDLPLGALCGVAIREQELTRIANDIFKLKLKHLGDDFARDKEMKGKELLKPYAFKMREHHGASRNLDLVGDLVHYLRRKKIPVFGTVCFQEEFKQFACQNMTALDKTFRYLFERIDMFMRIQDKEDMAVLVFDDRDHGTNLKNATAITNFFLRSPDGLSMDRVLDTPFFGISQSQNVGLQLADLVTTIIGMQFERNPNGDEFFQLLKPCFFRWQDPPGFWHSSLKVIRRSTDQKKRTPRKKRRHRYKKKAPAGPKARGQDKKA
jgi:hypothetical protein